MTFLHPEFLVWMTPGVLLLFYFWQTQKPREQPHFSEAILERLRPPEMTMGLKGRNNLFLIAAFLLIVAMAQPVILQNDPLRGGRADILIALDLSKKTPEAFKAEKNRAIDLIRSLEGENISLIGYDVRLYRISPATTDTAMMAALIKGLDADAMRYEESDVKKVAALGSGEEVQIIIGDPREEYTAQHPLLREKIEKLKSAHRLHAHIPLFYYPLGLAMLLILIALSSMSKRRSVPLAALLALLCLSELPSPAGILDFQELGAGYEAYEKGQYHDSAEHFKAYQKRHDSPEIRYNLGNAYYKAKEYEKAHYWYGRVTANDPDLLQKTAYNLRKTEQKIREKKGESDGIRPEVLRQRRADTPSYRPIKQRKEKGKTRLYPI